MNKKQDLTRINDEITSREVRLVGDNVVVGIYTLSDAKRIADQKELDLIEINPNTTPPICKIDDYGKYLYELKRKKKEQEKKNKQNASELKELRFTPNTDEHDFNFKLNHAKSFLSKGDKVKAYVFFKGREIAYKEKGEFMLLNFVNELIDIGQAESLPRLEGNKMSVIIKPRK